MNDRVAMLFDYAMVLALPGFGGVGAVEEHPIETFYERLWDVTPDAQKDLCRAIVSVYDHQLKFREMGGRIVKVLDAEFASWGYAKSKEEFADEILSRIGWKKIEFRGFVSQNGGKTWTSVVGIEKPGHLAGKNGCVEMTTPKLAAFKARLLEEQPDLVRVDHSSPDGRVIFAVKEVEV